MQEQMETLNGSKKHCVHQFNVFRSKMGYIKYTQNIQIQKRPKIHKTVSNLKKLSKWFKNK